MTIDLFIGQLMKSSKATRELFLQGNHIEKCGLIDQEIGRSHCLLILSVQDVALREIMGAVELKFCTQRLLEKVNDFAANNMCLCSLTSSGSGCTEGPPRHHTSDARFCIKLETDLTVQSRRPISLSAATVESILKSPIPVATNQFTTAWPQASIIVVVCDNLIFTKLCLASLLANSVAIFYEIIVVDNGSAIDTTTYLRQVCCENASVRCIFNSTNCGFAAANNQGLAIARGQTLILLNNDTIVSAGWIDRLVRHLGDPSVGLVGPVTNRIGNEAEVETTYITHGEYIMAASDRADRYDGQRFELPRPAMFCVAMRRSVFIIIGPLDERFQGGFFEDDDYAMRVHAAGFRTIGAEDVLIHHFGEASFGGLFASGERDALFQANRDRFERKWGLPWTEPRKRNGPVYSALIRSLGSAVIHSTIPEAHLLVVSRGDEALLQSIRINGRTASHFPQNSDQTYSGHYPTDDAEAIKHLRQLSACGADYLVFPLPAYWWLDHYPLLGEFLRAACGCPIEIQNVCLMFPLSAAARVSSIQVGAPA